MSPCLIVRTPGRLTTVQDEGRWGWQHLGVPVAGPMDLRAFRRANHLVGNPAMAAGLEMTLDGPTLEIVGPATLALAGAEASARLNGVSVPAGRPFEVLRAGMLEVGALRGGARACLAVAGGIETPVVLGSRATSLGVLGGRPVRAGDILPIGREPAHGTLHADGRRAAGDGVRSGNAHARGLTLRVCISRPDPDASSALESLCAGEYVLDAQSNRMGYRLAGPPVTLTSRTAFSAGTVMGMLQVPPDGQPILLMADRQTTGGYPVVGVVISADLTHAGQLGPGDRCRFVVCTRREAMAALLAQEQDMLGG